MAHALCHGDRCPQHLIQRAITAESYTASPLATWPQASSSTPMMWWSSVIPTSRTFLQSMSNPRAATNLRNCFRVAYQLLQVHCLPDPVQLADLGPIQDNLACPTPEFPNPYLRLSLSILKVTASALQPIVDKLEVWLSPWWASLLSRGERLTLSRHVLCTMPVHTLLAMVDNPPILKQLNRLICNLHWYGRKGFSTPSSLVASAYQICSMSAYPSPPDGFDFRELTPPDHGNTFTSPADLRLMLFSRH